MLITTNICILGAGPGGITAALMLDKLGYRCLVVDKATFPRDKICGDGISGKVTYAFKKIDPAIFEEFKTQNALKLNCWGVKFVLPKDREMVITFPLNTEKTDLSDSKAEAFISKRIDFDHFLFEKTKEKKGIEIRENVEITEFERVEGGFLLKEKEGKIEIKTQLVIVADGAQSRFARTIGGIAKENDHYIGAIRAYYKNLKSDSPLNLIELHYVREFFPGYFWVFPLPNGYANVGAGMLSSSISKRKTNLKKEFLEVIQHHPRFKERFKEAELVEPIKGFGLPLGSKKRTISGDNFLLVGDAASLIDPLTGEGIGNAVISGILAAEQAARCVETGNFSADFMKKYDEQVYDKLWKELQMSTRLQQSLKYPWLLNLLSGIAVRNKRLADMITAIFANVDLKAMFKNPLFFFKLLFNK